MLLHCLQVLHVITSEILPHLLLCLFLFLFAPFFSFVWQKYAIKWKYCHIFMRALAGLCSSGGFVLSKEEAYTRCVSLWWLHGVCQFTVKHNPGRIVVLVTALIQWSTFYIWKHNFRETASLSAVVIYKALLRPDVGTGSRHMTEMDILLISLLFSSEARWLQCCESAVAVVALWTWRASCGLVPPFSRTQTRSSAPPTTHITAECSERGRAEGSAGQYTPDVLTGFCRIDSLFGVLSEWL